MMKKRKLNRLFILCAITLLVSCAPTKDAAYFQNFSVQGGINNPDEIYSIEKRELDIINIGDELYITVMSGNADPNSFNQQTGGGLSSIPELLSYKVDNDGNITLPYLKKVKVNGKEVNEVAEELESQLSQYIYLPSVTIRIINNRVAVLGEVNAPGMYFFNRNTLNIYQAIAFAGDISTFGNRKNVLIVRKDGNKIQKKYIDLTNDQIINTQWYNIEPEDIIYIEPLGRKRFGMETFSIFSLVTLLTSSYLIYTIINSL